MYRLLIVDDEEIIRVGLQKGINWNALGFDLPSVAQNGRQALEMIDSLHPHVVLTDIRMPVMNGLELLDRIKKEHTGIRTIILSGYDDFEYARQGMASGAENYLLKPTKTQEIVEAFKRLHDEIQSGEQLALRQHEWQMQSQQFRSIECNRFFLKLVNGDLDKPELFEKERKRLQLDMPVSWSCCIVMKLDSKSGGPLPESGNDIIQSRLDQRKDLFPADQPVFMRILARDSDSLVLLLLRDKPFDPGFAEKLADLAGDEAHSLLGLLFSCGIGSQQSTACRAYRSMQSADLALKMAFYDQTAKVFAADQEQPRPPDPDQENKAQQLAEDVLTRIRQGQPDPLSSSLSRYLSHLEKMRCEPAWLLEQVALTLNEWIRQLAATIGDINTIKDAASFRSLSSCTSFTCLKERVISICQVMQAHASESLAGETIRKAILFLRNNYQNRIRLEDYAATLFLNPSYFSSYFKDKTGINFTQYLNNIRIEKAMELLARPDDHINEIADKVGFYDTAHFCRVFKKTVGLTPLDYRRQRFQ